MEFFNTIKTRKSTRSYKPGQISDKELFKVLLAGQSAPVGLGANGALHITVLQKSELIIKIVKTTEEISKNKLMDPFYGAPTIVIISSKANDDEAKVKPLAYAYAACIIENMHLAATDIGLGSVYLYSFIAAGALTNEYLKELEIPEGFTPLSAIALGYPKEKLTERIIPTDKISTNFIK